MRRERILLLLSLGLNAALCICLYNLRYDYRQLGIAFADESRDYGHTRRRLEELESSSRSRPTPQSALTDPEVLELARLRNEVTRLRNEQRTATNAPAARRAVPAAVAPPAVAPPLAEVVIFTNSVSAVLPLGHSLALGGWAEPGTGKRILGFVTPETTPDAPDSVMVQMRLMSVPDALLDRLGLQGLRAELPSGQPPRFDAAQIATLLKAMEQTDGVDVLSMPRVITSSGRQAQVAILNEREGGPTTGPVITLTPTLDASGTSVRLDVGVELKLLPQKPQP